MLTRKSRIPIFHILLVGLLPGFIKKIIYRLKGYRIGKGVHFGIGSVVIGDSVDIGEYSNFGFFTIIRGKSIKINRFVRIGSTTIIDTEKIEIDDDAKINEQVFIGGLSGPDSHIKIGKRTIIMQMSFLNPYKPLIIGDDSGIGGHCLLFTHGSWLSQLDGYPVSFAPITIGKNVWLPWRVFIMPGVEVGDNVVIGANSLVTKNIPPHSLVAGSPAKILVENYPNPINEDQRNVIIKTIFKEFIEFMIYSGFTCEDIENTQGKKIIISKDGKKYNIYYLQNHFDKTELSTTEKSLYIFDLIQSKYDVSLFNNGKMLIDLRSKTRFGTSDIGEEFVNFISRYGIRFDRLD